MIENPLSEEAFEQACRRISDFSAVNRVHEDPTDKLDALSVLRESLGISDDVLIALSEWVESLTGDEGYTPPVLLGLMVGLIAADHELES